MKLCLSSNLLGLPLDVTTPHDSYTSLEMQRACNSPHSKRKFGHTGFVLNYENEIW